MQMVEQQWKTLCQKDDLVVNSGVCALLDGEQIAIFCIGEDKQEVYAIGNYDPKGKANVLYRGIIGSIGDELVVASPLYKDHFSLTTGVCTENTELSVPVYQVRVSGQEVQVLV